MNLTQEQSSQTNQQTEGVGGKPEAQQAQPQTQQQEAVEIDALDMLSTENLARIAPKTDESGKAIEGQETAEVQNDENDENAKALKSSPFNNREKLEGGFINSFVQIHPDEQMPDISKLSVKDLVEKYKDLQREYRKQSTTPPPKEDYLEKFALSEKQKQKQNLITDPLSDKKTLKHYNLYIQEQVKNNVPYEKAKANADKLVFESKERMQLKTDITVLKSAEQTKQIEEMKYRASSLINSVKSDTRFNKADSAEVLKELDQRVKQQGLSEIDVIKIINTTDKKGRPYMLERMYEDAYNACLLRSNPKIIEEAKRQGAIEHQEKIGGGAISSAGVPSADEISAAQKENRAMYNLQSSLGF